MRFHNVNEFLFLIQLKYQYANPKYYQLYLSLSFHAYVKIHLYMYTYNYVYMYIHIYGLPEWWGWYRTQLPVQETKRCRLHPWVGKIPWRRMWQPIPVLFPSLENPVVRGPWWATVYRVTKSWTWLKQLGTHASIHTNTYLHTCNFCVPLKIFYELFFNKTVTKFLMSKC